MHYQYDPNTNDYRCMLDEERKININKAVVDPLGAFILIRLFEFAEVANPEDLKI